MMIPPGTLPARQKTLIDFDFPCALPYLAAGAFEFPCMSDAPSIECVPTLASRTSADANTIPFWGEGAPDGAWHEVLYLRSRRDFREISFRPRYGPSPRFQGASCQ